MFNHILGDMSPGERKRIRKLYRSIVAGKTDITTLNYQDAVRIEAKLQSELLCIESKSLQYEILISQLSKRESRLLPIWDSVASHCMLKQAEMIFDVFDDDGGAEISPPKEAEPPFCPWAVVDDRTVELYLAVRSGRVSKDTLDFADQCILSAMTENREKLTTFVAQIQSVIDAADEGKMNLNALTFEDMQKLSEAIDQIISK